MNAAQRRLYLVELAVAIACALPVGACSSDHAAPLPIDSIAAPNAAPTDSARPAVADKSKPVVHTEMQNVDMHIEPGIVLRIARLRGTVLPTESGGNPALNDKGSMVINIASADIIVDTSSLTTLLNRHVFGYKGSPLKKMHVSISNGQMLQTGTMHKVVDLPFRILATVSLTDSGEIRIHPTSVKVLGIGVRGVTDKLGGLGNLIKIEPGHGARIDHDDFILNVEQMLPPPRIRGRLTSIRIVNDGMRQTFGNGADSITKPQHRNGSTAKNFMYFHGGTLSFGKLTMKNTDLEIVDEDESNAFDYDLDRYQEHLVQGRSNSTMADGLVVHMPDIAKLKPKGPVSK